MNGKTMTIKQAQLISNSLYGKDVKIEMEEKMMKNNDSVFYVQMNNGVAYIVDADEMNTMERDQITFHKNGKMVGMVRSENVEMVFKNDQPKLV